MKKFIKNFLKVGTKNEETRVAWLKKILKQVPAGSRILDAGAGEQQFKKFCSHLNYVSQDFDKYDGKGDGAGLQTEKWDSNNVDIICDITEIPEPDKSFDAILCTEVFEHLPNPVLALKEFSRLLKKGGILIITAPFCSMTHFSPFHFYSGFNRYFYEKHLRDLGFDITDLEANGNFFEATAQKIWLLPFMSRQYAGKKFHLGDYFSSFLILMTLKRLSKNDKNSSELLNFGFHICAIKK